MNDEYLNFLKSKKDANLDSGFSISDSEISSTLFPFQRDVVKFLLKIGRGAAFLDTGLGKTIIQCEWAKHIAERTGGKVLLIAPLAVAQQTIREAKKLLDLDISFSRCGNFEGNLVITNYERLDNFDTKEFVGVVLDESSILKGFTGKIKRQLCDSFEQTPYRLACTATPAPNDHMEIGNHAEFLGVMPSTEMLARWFINDPSKVGSYRVKGHAVKSFWEWVASWAACVEKPSDLGYPNDGYDLPPLNENILTVSSPLDSKYQDGMLFDVPKVNATSLHKAKRKTLTDRVELVSNIVNSSDQPFIVWCESNAESAALAAAIPDSVEVKGSDSPELKERRLMAFSDGEERVIVSKGSICGFGMNWQHCRDIIFASISYSYEKYYQAVRRSWRFGQDKPVNVTIVLASDELPVWRTIEEKALSHREMKDHMKYAVFQRGSGTKTKLSYNKLNATMPPFLK